MWNILSGGFLVNLGISHLYSLDLISSRLAKHANAYT